MGKLNYMLSVRVVSSFSVSCTDRKGVQIEKVFTLTNGYPRSLVTSALKKVKQQIDGTARTSTEADGTSNSEKNDDPKILILKVPHAGDKGENLIKDLKTTLRRNLPKNLECRVIQTGNCHATSTLKIKSTPNI